MRIKEFMETTGLPRSSIRFYERKGLLEPEGTGKGNGYREYGQSQVERAMAIRFAQRVGFSLKEVRSLIDAWDKGRLDQGLRRTAIVEKLAEVDQKLAALGAMRAYLDGIVSWIDAGETGPKPVFGDAR